MRIYDQPSLTKDSIVWEKNCGDSEVCGCISITPLVDANGLAWGCKVEYTGESTKSGTVTIKATLNYHLTNWACETGAKSKSSETSVSVDGQDTGCSGSCAAGGSSGQPGSGGQPGRGGGLDFATYMGTLPDGLSAGYLSIASALPSTAVTDPAGLTYGFRQTGVFVYPPTGTLQQVKSPQALARVVDPTPNDGHYTIEFYYASDVTFNGIYYQPISGRQAFVTWTIHHPSGYSDTSHVEIVNSNGEAYNYVYSASNSHWTVTEPGNLRTVESWETTGSTPERGYEVWNGSVLNTKTVRTYTVISGTPYLHTVLEASDASTTQTTTYTLIPSGDNVGRPARIDYPDGRWEMFEYDEHGRVTVHYEAFADLAPPTEPNLPATGSCRRTTYDYTLLGDEKGHNESRPRTTIVDVPSYDESSSTWSWVTVSTRYYWTPDDDTEMEAISTRPGTSGCAWTDTDNLVTTRVLYDDPSDGLQYQKTKLMVHQDGTGSLFTYDEDSVSRTTVEKTGQLNEGKTAVLNGKEVTTIEDLAGRVLSVTEKLIDENVNQGNPSTVLALTTYTYSTSPPYMDYTVTDLANRPTQYHFNSCCGLLAEVVGPDGDKMAYGYDALKRRVVTTNIFGASGVVVTNVLDAAGRTLATYRYPMGGGTYQMLEMSDYDALGRVLHRTNAWWGVTSFAYDVGNRVTTTTNPDGGTRIETRYSDGRSESLGGTAVHPEAFSYGVQAEGAESVMRETTLWVKLGDTANATNEWTLTVSDDLGRVLKTYYAAASAPYPVSVRSFNNKGQLTVTVDPDGVTELFAYDDQGRQFRRAVDRNGNATIDDEADGNSNIADDMITDTIVDVLAAGASGNSRGVDIVRTRTYVFGTANSATKTLISTVEASTDGRSTWLTSYRDTGGGTPVTTSNVTGVPSSGSRTDTITNPDGSYRERIHAYNRLVTDREKNPSGGEITSHSVTYDAYGRLWTDTDVRNGVTTYAYYASDQYESVTAPPLGSGEGQQVTSYSYDQQGRLSGQMFPDGTVVTNFYFETGLLEKTWGSRMYPVAYTYDTQGRMKSMSTWQTFSGGAGTPAVTTWIYSSYRGWLDAKHYPNATTGAEGTAGPSYTYTDAGRLETRTWDRGVVTTYDYTVKAGTSDTAGELRLITYSDSTPAVSFTYDRRGRRAGASCNSITTSYAYNEADQVLSESYSGGSLNGLSVVRTYDAYLRLSTLDAKNGATVLQTTLYTYDTAGRLDKVKDNASTSYYAAYGYASGSRLVSALAFTNNTSGEGLLTTRAWDKLNRLESISSQAYLNGATTGSPMGFAYKYDQANQRNRAELSDGSYWVYEYDSLGQVTKGRRYWSDGSLMAGQMFEYKFDDIGNRDSTGGRASSVSDYTVDQLNRYTQRTTPATVDIVGIANPTANVEVWKDSDSHSVATRKGEYFHLPLAVAYESYPLVHAKSLYGSTQTTDVGHPFVPAQTEAFTYDADGNMTSDGRWTIYAWSGENRLLYMRRDTTSPSGAKMWLLFEYDYQGRRIRKRLYIHNGSTWVEQTDTIYLYDGWNMIAELDANASNATLRTYVWGSDLSGTMTGAGGVGGLLWVKNAQTSYGGQSLPTGLQFVAFDGNGNVAGLFAAADGSNTATYEYGPFGETLRQTGTMAKANPARWSTKGGDNESGLVYYGYRYYTPSIGRWISRDPKGESASCNSYGYVHNEALSRCDPVGLIDFPPGVIFTPMECRLALCMWKLARSYKRIHDRAAAEARGVWGGIGDQYGPQDTLRHCLAGCYLAKEWPSFGCPPDESVADAIRFSEWWNSNNSKVDADNSVVGSEVPPTSSCLQHCLEAQRSGRIKDEKPRPGWVDDTRDRHAPFLPPLPSIPENPQPSPPLYTPIDPGLPHLELPKQ